MSTTLASSPTPPLEKQTLRRRIDQLIDGAPNLPAAFEILPQLFTLLDDPQSDCSDLAELIRIDPSLTAAVLRVSNSARYRGGDTTESLSDAITRLGLREIFRVVLEIVTAPALNNPPTLGRMDLWRHSLATAVASQVFSERLNREHPEIVFSVGLLHDIGKTILFRAAREPYLDLLRTCAERNESVESAERDCFAIDHAEVAGLLLRAWKFPERIAAAVADHHHPQCAAKEHQTLAALVCVGNTIAHNLGIGNGYTPFTIPPNRDALRILGLPAGKVSDHHNEILERIQREQDRV